MLVTTLYLTTSKHSVRTLALFKSDLMLLSRKTLLLPIEMSVPILQLVSVGASLAFSSQEASTLKQVATSVVSDQ